MDNRKIGPIICIGILIGVTIILALSWSSIEAWNEQQDHTVKCEGKITDERMWIQTTYIPGDGDDPGITTTTYHYDITVKNDTNGEEVKFESQDIYDECEVGDHIRVYESGRWEKT